MAGLSKDTPWPTAITSHRKSRRLDIVFSDGASYALPFEFLRVFSPSAEVRGHGPGQETLQVGKQDVDVLEIVPVGHYAVQLKFSDGHDTGIYSWDYLYDLGRHQDELWRAYLEKLAAAGASRSAREA